jgi:hypothetical protein
MTPTPPFPETLWNTASPEFPLAIVALVRAYEQRLTALEAQLNDL